MRVFVTGASGFVGSAVVKDLLAAGHQVLGMVRSDKGAEKVAAAGAEVHRGDIYDLESVKSGAAVCDAVIHTAFDHDFSKFKENCETDRKVVTAIASVLEGTDKPFVITSGVGLVSSLGRPANEDDVPQSSNINPRVASEEAAMAAAAKGVDTYIMRLPPTVHGAGEFGFIPMVINVDKSKGASAYIGDGANRWPAVHRFDAAALYRLAIEKKPSLKVFHAVAEEGIPFKEIAEAIGKGLNLPVVSKTGDEATEHFGWFSHFAGLDCPSTATKTIEATGWSPKEPGLIKDMFSGWYFELPEGH
jgi:nucleoside-diphosphate-sugar epimerase